MDEREIICQYQQILVGGFIGRPRTLYASHSKRENIMMARTIFRYAIENILGWDPDNARYMLTKPIMQRLRLDMFLPMLDLPRDLNSATLSYWIIAKVYPERYQLGKKDIALKIYNDVLAQRTKIYPKRFFLDSDGRQRAILCLRYVLTQKETFASIEDIYRTFVVKQNALAFLSSYRLRHPYYVYWKAPIDYIHEALPKDMRSEVWYHYYTKFDKGA